jgi:hypothetical protein
MKSLTLTGVVLAATSLSACGGKGIGGIVRDVKLETRTDPATQDIYADLTSIVEVGGLQFPSLTLPIVDPKNPFMQYGTLTLARTADRKNAVIVSTNLTELSQANLTVDRTLPNGNPIPVYGEQDLITLPIQKAGKVYLDLSQNRKLLGFAIAIKEFQNIGKYAPGLNLFFDIPSNNGIEGIGGVFTGAGEYQNGIALFLDVTDAINKAMPSSSSSRIAAASLDTAEVSRMQSQQIQPQDWVFVKQDSALNSSKARKVLGDIYKMSSKTRVINVAK